ncbi:MAG TPA: VTT domain-containing protein [Candidatus Cybelea sp.]|nr:VTT domain-containing protein [Candidatus Cybelea sp.]
MNRLLRRCAALALLAASFALAYWVIRHQPRVEHEIRAIGPWAYPLAIAIFGVVASAPFSVTDALAIMNGAIFGPVRGTLVDTAGLVVAALFGYWINLHATRLLNLHEALEKLPAWVKRFPVGSPAFLLAVRVIPGFGGTVATATAAAFRVPVWVHVWTMCAIAVPICALLTIFGDRVTVAVHRYEWRASRSWHLYCMTHRCPHFHFRRRFDATATPSPGLPTP